MYGFCALKNVLSHPDLAKNDKKDDALLIQFDDEDEESCHCSTTTNSSAKTESSAASTSAKPESSASRNPQTRQFSSIENKDFINTPNSHGNNDISNFNNDHDIPSSSNFFDTRRSIAVGNNYIDNRKSSDDIVDNRNSSSINSKRVNDIANVGPSAFYGSDRYEKMLEIASYYKTMSERLKLRSSGYSSSYNNSNNVITDKASDKSDNVFIVMNADKNLIDTDNAVINQRPLPPITDNVSLAAASTAVITDDNIGNIASISDNAMIQPPPHRLLLSSPLKTGSIEKNGHVEIESMQNDGQIVKTACLAESSDSIYTSASTSSPLSRDQSSVIINGIDKDATVTTPNVSTMSTANQLMTSAAAAAVSGNIDGALDLATLKHLLRKQRKMYAKRLEEEKLKRAALEDFIVKINNNNNQSGHSQPYTPRSATSGKNKPQKSTNLAAVPRNGLNLSGGFTGSGLAASSSLSNNNISADDELSQHEWSSSSTTTNSLLMQFVNYKLLKKGIINTPPPSVTSGHHSVKSKRRRWSSKRSYSTSTLCSDLDALTVQQHSSTDNDHHGGNETAGAKSHRIKSQHKSSRQNAKQQAGGINDIISNNYINNNGLPENNHNDILSNRNDILYNRNDILNSHSVILNNHNAILNNNYGDPFLNDVFISPFSAAPLPLMPRRATQTLVTVPEPNHVTITADATPVINNCPPVTGASNPLNGNGFGTVSAVPPISDRSVQHNRFRRLSGGGGGGTDSSSRTPKIPPSGSVSSRFALTTTKAKMMTPLHLSSSNGSLVDPAGNTNRQQIHHHHYNGSGGRRRFQSLVDSPGSTKSHNNNATNSLPRMQMMTRRLSLSAKPGIAYFVPLDLAGRESTCKSQVQKENMRKTFLSRSLERKQKITTTSELRQRLAGQSRELAEHVLIGKISLKEAGHALDALPDPPSAFSRAEMVRASKKKFQALPEVQQRREKLLKEFDVCTNRIRAKMYCQKTLHRALSTKPHSSR